MKSKLHRLFTFTLLLFGTFQASSQCANNSYKLDWKVPSTYIVSCGTIAIPTINPAQWTVKNDSCIFTSPQINVGGTVGGESTLITTEIRINQSGNLTSSDFAWIRYYINGVLVFNNTIRGDTVSTRVYTLSDSIYVPAGGNLVIQIILKTTATNRFWQIKDNDITACVRQPVPLPINLLYFEAIDKREGIELRWATATETNNHYFTILKSADGKNYDALIRVMGAGNSNHQIKYVVADAQPVAGNNYYQLMQTDFDGKSTLSKVVVACHEYVSAITIYPTILLGGKLHVTGLREGPYQIDIVKLDGVLAKHQLVESQEWDVLEIEIDGLRAGAYLVSVSGINELITQKIIIK